MPSIADLMAGAREREDDRAADAWRRQKAELRRQIQNLTSTPCVEPAFERDGHPAVRVDDVTFTYVVERVTLRGRDYSIKTYVVARVECEACGRTFLERNLDRIRQDADWAELSRAVEQYREHVPICSSDSDEDSDADADADADADPEE